jgi:hypothetical protein
MIAKTRELKAHVIGLNNVLREICDAPQSQRLVEESHGYVYLVFSSTQLARKVTTDLGRTEVALRLPIPDTERPRYWIGLHELWKPEKRSIRFQEGGLRLYVGGRDEEALQFLRLEWIAPSEDPDGKFVYQGSHAGHPHWHIDRSALVGAEEHLRSLELLTRQDAAVEDFSEATTRLDSETTRLLYDCSWLQRMHLPAQADWMLHEWDGRALPAPHQCQPQNVSRLASWWTGALRYLVAELPR